jgi:hypothetical protein
MANNKNSKTLTPHKIGDDNNLPVKGVKTQHLADNAVTERCIADSSIYPRHLSPALSFQTVPVGTIVSWYDYNGTLTIPSGWLYCNGQIIDVPDSPLYLKYTPDLSASFMMGGGSAGAGDIGLFPTDSGTANDWSDSLMIGQNNTNSTNISINHAHTAATHAADTFGTGSLASLSWPTFQWDKAVLNVDQLPHYHVEAMNIKDTNGNIQRTYEWGQSTHTVDFVQTPTNVLTSYTATSLLLPHNRPTTVAWNSSLVTTSQVGGAWSAGSLPSFTGGLFNGGTGSLSVNSVVNGNCPRSLPVRYIMKII